ncbi:hypothetical protein QF030_005319 [Streptomyces rishiriensis]|uniref:Uncharacterized protein n=1 Tax=Streptomyces rishiriensis TaxID=68264 RepID=A0ABU0NVF9_STRRH|nr:hypothetical protein [Streptomyces rishiriensis]
MDVEEEAQRGSRDPLGAGHRADGHRLARGGDVRDRYRTAVDEQGADLREGHSERLDDMAEGGDAVDGERGRSRAPRVRDEQGQRRGDFDADLE